MCFWPLLLLPNEILYLLSICHWGNRTDIPFITLTIVKLLTLNTGKSNVTTLWHLQAQSQFILNSSKTSLKSSQEPPWLRTRPYFLLMLQTVVINNTMTAYRCFITWLYSFIAASLWPSFCNVYAICVLRHVNKVPQHVSSNWLYQCVNDTIHHTTFHVDWQNNQMISLYLIQNILHNTFNIMQKWFFSVSTLLAGWQEEHLDCKKLEWWDAGVLV